VTARHSGYRHQIGGGWAPDFGPTAEVEVSENIRVPWLVNADNIFYLLDGGPRKIGGTEKLNSGALESGANVMGLYDYWKFGTTGSPTQKRVLHVGTKIKKDDADGNFSDIFTGLTAGAIPSYATFDDYLVIMSSEPGDVPRYWDQTTPKNLGTNTPDCAFGVTHKSRFWMAGDVANPSRLYYSMALPNGADDDWNDGTAGFLDINPGDGDGITGLASHKNELWVFKGPYKGSIHRITGSSPSDYARKDFVFGLGAINHNSIFRFSDDIGFVSQFGSVHSLAATSAFGDFHEAALSLPLNQWLGDHVRHDRLKYCWAAPLPSRGRVVFTLATDTSTTNNTMLCMDYRFMPTEGAPRWSPWPAMDAACVANVVDPTGSDLPGLFVGGNDGFVRKLDRSNRSLDGTTGYTAKVTFPFLHYGDQRMTKTLEEIAVGISPRGDYDLTVGWTRDDNAQQTATVSQGGGDVLAPADANQFTLGTSRLGGAQFADRFLNLETGGEFRSIQYEFTNGGNDEDMEIHSMSAFISAGTWSSEN
jgi:hypothetical protein